jgi:hypothetical protein
MEAAMPHIPASLYAGTANALPALLRPPAALAPHLSVTHAHATLAPYRAQDKKNSGAAESLRRAMPHAVSASFSQPIVPGLGASAEVIRDMHGRVYVEAALNAGIGKSLGSPIGVGAKWFDTKGTPGKDTLRCKLAGLSFSVHASAGAGKSFNLLTRGTATTASNGASIGVSISYTVLLKG